MEFQEKLRVAEIEKSQLEAEIQSLRDQMAQCKAEADKWVAHAAGAAGVCAKQGRLACSSVQDEVCLEDKLGIFSRWGGVIFARALNQATHLPNCPTSRHRPASFKHRLQGAETQGAAGEGDARPARVAGRAAAGDPGQAGGSAAERGARGQAAGA